MNDLTKRIDPPKEENEDFEAERIEYEDEHGIDYDFWIRELFVE
jgi:hypothetical protein